MQSEIYDETVAQYADRLRQFVNRHSPLANPQNPRNFRITIVRDFVATACRGVTKSLWTSILVRNKVKFMTKDRPNLDIDRLQTRPPIIC